MESSIRVASNSNSNSAGGQKRAAIDSSSDRAAKRRSSRACLSCRTRKVRCDVVSGGVPCTNCRLDGVDCHITDSNRGRRPTVTNNANNNANANTTQSLPGESPRQSPTPPPTVVQMQQHPPPQSRRQSSSEQVPSPHTDVPNDYLVSLTFESSSPKPDQPSGNCSTGQEHGHNVCGPSYPGQTTTPLSLDDNVPQGTRALGQPQPLPLPCYIRALPRNIQADDMEYLARKGALTIPDRQLRDELLKTYVNIVYTFMPAIDLESFIVPIIQEDSKNPVSLLLFQAVMFAAVTFIDTPLLHARGYQSRKAARKVYFNRVRLLYGLDCEPDRLSLIQALLLMTSWYDSPDDEKDTWYWMGIALSLSQVAGLHRDPKPLQMPMRDKQLRSRIWWSCLMRDRLLALGIRRPARIRDDDFSVPMLNLDDFDLSPPSDTLISLLGTSDLTGRNPASRSVVASMCIQLCKLCLCVGNILRSQYSVLGSHPMGSEYLVKVMAIPERSTHRAQDLARCEAELGQWLHNLDPSCRYKPAHAQPATSSGPAAMMIHLHQTLLHMIYLTALGALHRPQVFNSSSESTAGGIDQQNSRQKITDAAIAMTGIAYDLQTRDQLRYLSTSSIPAFLSATLIHLLDIRSPNEQARNVSIGRFYQCLQALHRLQEMYASADYAVQFLKSVLKKTDVYIPMLDYELGISRVPIAGERNWSNSMQPSHISVDPQTGMMAYPTPSSSNSQRDLPANADMYDRTNTNANGCETAMISGDGGATMQFPIEGLGLFPQLEDWGDANGLLPALITSDADPTWFLSNNGNLSHLDTM